MSNNIVVVNVSQTQAPTPSKLQKTGAFITQGGTTTAPQTLTLLTQLSDLTPIIAPAKALTSLAWSTSVVTATTTAAHGWNVGDVVQITVAGAVPAGYNGTFTGTVTSGTVVTYPLASNPGSETTPGTIALGAVGELNSMATTFFAQGGGQSVYVLELGEGAPAVGPPDLTTFITANPNKIYSYLVPREWDNLSAFMSILSSYEAANAKTYFFVTTTIANQTVYAAKKCVLAMVEAPAIGPNEFSLASVFFVTLNYDPNSTNRVPPISYAYLFGVTAYPLPGNGSVFTNLNTNNVSWVGTGAEGGISNTILFYGQMQDSNPFNYWYAADWAQINIELSLSNEVINGSNDPLAPLYYDQQGINRLQNRTLQTLGSAISAGLGLGTLKATALPAATFTTNFEAGDYLGNIVVNAEPFSVYTAENPNDYAIGKYGGLACVFTPLRGFKQIIFNLNITNIVS